MMKKYWLAALPLLIVSALLFFLWRGLSLDPTHLPSTLIGKPMPHFELSDLRHPEKKFSSEDIRGHAALINIWGSWCTACQVEHKTLMNIARSGAIKIYGIDYHDTRAAAQAWLKNLGNPYTRVGFDPDGRAIIHWGVYGTPETYLVDAQGIIRYKQVGPLTEKVWREKVLPLVQ